MIIDKMPLSDFRVAADLSVAIRPVCIAHAQKAPHNRANIVGIATMTQAAMAFATVYRNMGDDARDHFMALASECFDLAKSDGHESKEQGS